MLSNVTETDVAIAGESVRVLRYGAPQRAPVEKGEGGSVSRLEKSPEGGLDRIGWKSLERRTPKVE